MTTSREEGARSGWPRRLALATLLCALPLVFFGSSVTTLGAGLAVEGWLVLDPGAGDHFLWLYPVEKWFRDLGTFVEHSHRLIGSLVGILAVATVAATLVLDRRRVTRVLAVAALGAVVLQGVLGGLRVLERSDDLAFLHGGLGQAVFALLGASAIVASRGWGRARPCGREGGSLARKAWIAVAFVYAQSLAGAWLRHGGSGAALALHLLLALVVMAVVLGLARDLGAEGSDRLSAQRRGLLVLLAARLLLGLLSFVVVFGFGGAAQAGLGASVIPTLHVVLGAMLLLQCLSCAMWALRLYAAAGSATAEAGLEGAR